MAGVELLFAMQVQPTSQSSVCFGTNSDLVLQNVVGALIQLCEWLMLGACSGRYANSLETGLQLQPQQIELKKPSVKPSFLQEFMVLCSVCIRRAFPLTLSWCAGRTLYSAPLNAGRRSTSTTLLARARSLSEEHATLSIQVAEHFDAKTARKVGELMPVASAFKEWQRANESLRELRTLVDDPSTDAELHSLASEDIEHALKHLENASQALTASVVPKHPFADLPCLLEIRPGAGGSEAALFAGDILRMYQLYCTNRGLHANLLSYEAADGTADPNGSDAPLQEAILEIDSAGAYDLLRCEAGVHRVQRVPATESKGRVHTSTASVLVLPSFSDSVTDSEMSANANDPASDYYVDLAEVRTDIMRAKGAGGQHVNKTESAVRLTHMPTGIVVAIQDSRSQPKNKEKAWKILRSRLAQRRREAREEELLALRRAVGGGVGKTGRADKIRTYNWQRQMVTDHRSGVDVHDLGGVLEGGSTLELVMESVRRWMIEQQVAAL